MKVIAWVDDTGLELPETEFRKPLKAKGAKGNWHSVMSENPAYVLAGFCLENSKLTSFSNAIQKVKKRFGLIGTDPVKWNFRDLERFYNERRAKKRFEKALPKSEELREALLKLLNSHGAKIICCSITSYTKRTERKDCLSWAAENLFQRLGFLAEEIETKSLHTMSVVMDRPSTGEEKEILKAYEFGFKKGKTINGQGYFAGPLRKLGFMDSVLFGSANFLPALQMADLIAGATRDFLEWVYKGEKESRTHRFFPLIHPCFYKSSMGETVRYGLNVSPKPGFDLEKKISNVMKRHQRNNGISKKFPGTRKTSRSKR